MHDLSKVRRVLIINLKYIGDVLLSTPVIEAIKKERKNISIAMLVNEGTETTLYNNPDLDEIFVINSRWRWGRQLKLIRTIRSFNFDLSLDLTDGDRAAILGRLCGIKYRIGYNREQRWRGVLYHQIVTANREELHTVDYFLEIVKALGCAAQHSGPRIYPSAIDNFVLEQFIQERGLSVNMPFVVIHPGSRWWFKSWPTERFVDLARQIHKEFGFSVVVVGGVGDVGTAEKIVSQCGRWAVSAAGQITLLQLGALIKRASLFVGNDAGPMHVAAAVQTPVVGLFGPTNPRVWSPWGKGHEVIWKQIDCTPCWKDDDCDRGDLNCMRQISADEVWVSVKKVLKRN
jgi:predicted lipopolysaccharide heptosyltransferase III